MLYNEGEQFSKVYYDGKQIQSIYYNGQCIYPGFAPFKDLRGVINNYQPTFNASYASVNITSIKFADSLPSGITTRQLSRYDVTLQYSAFYDEIPNWSYYDIDTTYHAGDVVIKWDGDISIYPNLLTYIKDGNNLRTFSSYYKYVTECYDETKIYNVGDIVYAPLASAYYTLFTRITPMYEPEPWDDFIHAGWYSNYCPGGDIYHSGKQYRIGDVVYDSGWVYTCKIEHTGGSSMDYSKFRQGYFPELIGMYDSSKTYYIGDVVLRSTDNSIYTCISTEGIVGRITDTNYWTKNYSPELKFCVGNIHGKGKFTESVQYETGDIVMYSNYARLVTYPTLPKHSNEYLIYYWFDDDCLYIYCDNDSIRSNFHLMFYTSSDSKLGPYVTDISALSHIDTSYTADMYLLFSNYQSLSDLSPITNWNTSNVVSFRGAFEYCYALSDLTPLVSWNTSSAITFENLFRYCSSITTLDGLNYWSTDNVQTLARAFHRCSTLADISALSGWNTSSVRDMQYLFCYCSLLSDISPLSNWNISNVTDMSYMFSYCTNLNNIQHLTNWNTSNVTNMSYMFAECEKLSDISSLADWDTSNLTNMSYMFRNCDILSDISPLADWDTSKVTTLQETFAGCLHLTTVEDIHWNLQSLTNIGDIFSGCPLSTLRELYWTNLRRFPDFDNKPDLVKPDFSRCTLAPDVSGLSTGTELFTGSSNVEECDLGTIFSSTSMKIWTSSGGPFSSCKKLRLIIIRRTSSILMRTSYHGDYDDGLNNLISNHGKVYVPQSMIDTYRNDTGWSLLFNSGVELLPLEGSQYEQPGSL